MMNAPQFVPSEIAQIESKKGRFDRVRIIRRALPAESEIFYRIRFIDSPSDRNITVVRESELLKIHNF